MYKKYNFKANSLSPVKTHRSLFDSSSFSLLAEKLLPFLVLATAFVWLWK